MTAPTCADDFREATQQDRHEAATDAQRERDEAADWAASDTITAVVSDLQRAEADARWQRIARMAGRGQRITGGVRLS